LGQCAVLKGAPTMTDEKRRPGRPPGTNTRPLTYTERLQILITPEQRARLDREALRQSETAGKVVTVADLIRAAIDKEYP
jgi:hypothetical protein